MNLSFIKLYTGSKIALNFPGKALELIILISLASKNLSFLAVVKMIEIAYSFKTMLYLLWLPAFLALH